MGLKFRKSVKIAPGVRLNLTKNGVSSLSVGKNGARVNIGKKGVRTTAGLPGTGISYSKFSSYKKEPSAKTGPDFTNPDNFLGYPKSEWIIAGVIGLFALVFFIWIIS